MCLLIICDVVVACKTYADAMIYNQNHHRLKNILWFATHTNGTQFWSRSWVIPHRNVPSFAYIVPNMEEIVEIFEYILHFQIISLTAVATSDTKSTSVNAANVVWCLLANSNQSNYTEMKVNRQRSNHIITEEITHNYSNRLNRICFRLRECKGMRKKKTHAVDWAYTWIDGEAIDNPNYDICFREDYTVWEWNHSTSTVYLPYFACCVVRTTCVSTLV